MLAGRGHPTRILTAAALALAVVACGTAATPPAVEGGGDSTVVDTEPERHVDDFWDGSEPIDASGPTVRDTVIRPGPVTVLVGDSVLVSISDDVAARVPGTLVFDAANCRQLGQEISGGCGHRDAVSSGLDAIEDTLGRLEPGSTPDVAVLVLANNSSITADEVDAAMDLLVGTPRVWWVNARIDGFGRQATNNDVLDDLARRDPRAGVVDWYSASDDPDLFRDHVHPDERGQARLARLIRDHIACDCTP